MNSGRLLTIIATVSPLPTPIFAKPPAILRTRSATSFHDMDASASPSNQVIAGSSPSRSTLALNARGRFSA